MLQSRKNKSILKILQDRELSIKCAPYFSSVSVISQLLHSDKDRLYRHHWNLTSHRPMTYDCGYVYFSNYTQFCSTFGQNDKPASLLKMQKSKAKLKVSDVISYSVPIYKTVDDICKCGRQMCKCFSQYLISVSEDNWLCQHLMTDGKIMKEIYVKCVGHKFRFKYCDWDVYGERFVLTSTLNPLKHPTKRKSDVVVSLAIFTVFPLEFLALLEIKRSVFGERCTAANISDQHLILGQGSFEVHIYSFEDFLQEGNLESYKLGDIFEHEGKVGSYPTGLPLNFTYSKAPPLLFNVACMGQIIRFGGYPYHYVIATVPKSNTFMVKNIETEAIAKGGLLQSSPYSDEVDSLLFHPDHSNRLIFRTNTTVDCYKLTHKNNVSEISKLFSMGFFEKKSNQPTISSFGRKIKMKSPQFYECSIFSTDYASDLDLFAILGVYSDRPTKGFVRLYESVTGDEVRTIELKEEVHDHYFYQLYVDMGSIIIIEKKDNSEHTIHVYNL